MLAVGGHYTSRNCITLYCITLHYITLHRSPSQDRLTSVSTDESSQGNFGSRNGARRMLRRLAGVSAGPSAVHSASFAEVATDVHASIGRQVV